MPGKDEHVAQARHNRDFWSALELPSTPYLDWVVAGLFCEANHWAEALLATRGEHSGDHRERLFAMRRNRGDFGAIAGDLDVLKQESESARYRCYKHAPADVSGDLIPVIERIRGHVEAKLTNPLSP